MQLHSPRFTQMENAGRGRETHNSFTNCTAVDLASHGTCHPSGFRAIFKRAGLSILSHVE